jgi:hypothetical protein
MLYKRSVLLHTEVYKKLKAVSRQPLINFVNLKSNTIMKKPRRKGKLISRIYQVFSSKRCYDGTRKVQININLLYI